MTCPCSLPQQVSMVSQSSFSPISHFYESSEIYSTDHFLNSGMKSSLLTPYLGCYLPFPCVLVLPFLHLKADVIICNMPFCFYFSYVTAIDPSQTITTFNNPVEGCLGKHCGENEKMLVTHIFSFSPNVF